MNDGLESILLGTAGLAFVALLALSISIFRPAHIAAHAAARRVRTLAAVAILLHCVHFIEEWRTGFPARFPDVFGLAPWPDGFFLPFNIFWIALWSVSVVFLRARPTVAVFPLWFLAIASAANAIAHPLLALLAQGYFPGLWSSPLVGIVGVLLLHALVALTDPEPSVESRGAG